MGYTTDFSGRLELNRPLTVPEYNWLKAFNLERHEGVTEEGKPYPGIWCQWVGSEDGLAIEWDGGEKFYEYVHWLRWLIAHYLRDQGLVLNGTIRWEGEDSEDVGLLHAHENKITTEKLQITGRVECPSCGHKFLPESV